MQQKKLKMERNKGKKNNTPGNGHPKPCCPVLGLRVSSQYRGLNNYRHRFGVPDYNQNLIPSIKAPMLHPEGSKVASPTP